MASLAEREGLRGKVQCIYLDPPYGIKFNSNFQWSTTSRDVRDGNAGHITREPEQVKAFRDTWRDGIHSYLTYLRDRLTVARDLLAESGSVFVQIGDENVHRVRALMDEVFGEENFSGQISFRTTGGQSNSLLASSFDILLWYSKEKDSVKYRPLFAEKPQGSEGSGQYVLLEHPDGVVPPSNMTKEQKEGTEPLPTGYRVLAHDTLYSAGAPSNPEERTFRFQGKQVKCPTNNHWKPGGRGPGMERLYRANRLLLLGATLRYKRYWHDFGVRDYENLWVDTGRSGFAEKKKYVVETAPKVIERCILMTTDPGDLVLDPTCGSGTTAYVSEEWGRRWITSDTSRVALALARARIMGARYPYYLLADSRDGQVKEAEISRKAPSEAPTSNDIRQGFVYERVPHITLKSIANNAEIDVIWEKFQETLEPLRAELNAALNRAYEEWEIPARPANPWSDAATAAWNRLQGVRTAAEKSAALGTLNKELGREYALDDVPDRPRDPWEAGATDLHGRWWEQRIARQKEIDASIAAKADYEYLYDKPYEDNKKVRVAGPFTVESLSPHRLLGVDENDELVDNIAEASLGYGAKQDFAGDDPRPPQDLRRAAGPQGGPNLLLRDQALARGPRLRRGNLRRRQRRVGSPETRRHLHRPGVRHRVSPRSRVRGAGGRRRRLRRAGRLRLQLRRPCLGVQQARPCPGPQGAHERRPPYGRRPQEHGQGQPLRHLRRAGHRPPRRRGRGDPGQGQGRRCVPPQHR